MAQLNAMISRNVKIYLRDRMAVFFSLLSMLIVIVLMVFFLGDMNIEAITGMLEMLPGRDADLDAEHAEQLVLAWTCAGIISINAVSVTLSCLTTMIQDRANGKLNSIYTAPVNRVTIAISYIVAAWIVSMIICTLTLVITELYCVSCGMEPYSVEAHLQLIGMIGMNSFTYASMMYFLATLVRSESAWGGLGTIIGTLVGFLGGIYLPIGSLSDGIATIMKCTPVIYGTSMFRTVMTKDILTLTFDGAPEEMVEEYSEVMGIDLFISETQLAVGDELLILLATGVLFLIASVLVIKLGKRTDR